MKLLARYAFYFAFVAFLIGCGATSPDRIPALPLNDGTTTSGGGESVELEFKVLGRSLHERLEQSWPDTHQEMQFGRWKESLESVQIIPRDTPLVLRGKPVDAINYPDRKQIEIYRPHWLQLNAWERERLVLHEIFGIARMDDKQYWRTYAVMGKLINYVRLSFPRFTFSGPVASVFARHFDWSGSTPFWFPFFAKGKRGYQYVLSAGLDRQNVVSCLVESATALSGKIMPGQRLEIESASCLLSIEGVFDSNRSISIRDEKQQEAFEVLWSRLNPQAKRSFRYPSIRGTETQEEGREIRLQLEFSR